jgi:WD40 repeat protein
LASASDDSTLKLWNVATQQELVTIRRLGGTVRELLFSPDGTMLVGSRGVASRSGVGLRFYRAPQFEQIGTR